MALQWPVVIVDLECNGLVAIGFASSTADNRVTKPFLEGLAEISGGIGHQPKEAGRSKENDLHSRKHLFRQFSLNFVSRLLYFAHCRTGE